MTGPKQSREDRSADQLLAGKYVLGLLSQEARQAVEDRMRRDRGFARTVMLWSQNTAAGIDEEDRVSPFTRRVAVHAEYPHIQGRRRDLLLLAGWQIWRSAAFWRATTLMLFIVVLTLLTA